MATMSNSLNRIYQGRVTGLEIETITETTSVKGKVTKTAGWASPLKTTALLPLLSDFTELFQDAVNYYLVALLGMATDPVTPAGKVRAELVSGSTDSVWESFRRRGVNRPGLRASVAKHLGFAPGATPGFEEVVAKIFADNPASIAVREAALKRLLDACSGDGAIQQNGRSYWPLLCDETSDANSPDDSLVLQREYHQELMPYVLHHIPGLTHDSDELKEFNLYSVAKPAKEGGKLVLMSAEKATLLFDAAIKNCFASTPSVAARLVTRVAKTEWAGRIPDYTGGSVNKEALLRRFHAWIIFEYLEKSADTLAKLREVFPVPKKSVRPSPPAASGDPISDLRGSRGYAFPPFTRVVGLDWENNNFDIVAFKEALKALNQISAKGEERAKKQARLEAIRDYQKTAAKTWSDKLAEHDESVAPPKLAGDPRIDRLEALLTGELAAAYEATEGESTAYGLRPRTIRGFDTLAKRWNAAADKHRGSPKELAKKLKDLLTEYQIEQAETMGSVVLFDALIDDPQNHLIWKTPSEADLARWRTDGRIPATATFADNPLQALTDSRELDREITELEKPILLTPADAINSPRQILLTETGPKEPHLKTGHTGVLQLVTPIAIRTESGAWSKQQVRLTYAAPRLLRDGLRGPGEAALEKAPWLQPMMAALGLVAPIPQDFSTCAVHLMPSVRDGVVDGLLLNFPLSLEVGPVIAKLGTASRWAGMFGVGRDFEPAWLHWPTSLAKEKHPSAWWLAEKPFRTLSIDLGTRDAGAFAVLESSPAAAPAHTRFLGQIEKKSWHAKLLATGLLRLPGEDAKIFRAGRLQTEFSGEKGRLATRAESESARALVESLGLDPAAVLGETLADTRRLSFPEQNDKLLYALRRAQGRLARLQSWSALLHPKLPDSRKNRIRAEIAESDDLPEELRAKLTAGDEAGAVLDLCRQAELLRSLLREKLLEIADRVLPWRDRRWEWVPHPASAASFLLRPTAPGTDDREKLIYGQRGLSLERIEQLEELRHRAQSLNRAITHTLGAPAKFGRANRGDELPDPCPAILEKLAAMREQRVKQTAHLILAQALGVRLKPHSTESRETREARDIHGEYEKIPGRTPVDFIVLEDLNRYLADQGRSRAENSRLMQWSHRAIVERVRQLAETYGIPVLTTPAAYTSRFCSRTGRPGFRAEALHPLHRHEFPWRNDLAKLAAIRAGTTQARDKDELARLESTAALFAQLDTMNADLLKNPGARPRWQTLLAPRAGGPLFVAIGSDQAVQADINAAINIGLRAIASPDNAAIHHRIRAKKTKTGHYEARVENAREKARWKGAKSTDIIFTDASAKHPTDTFANFFHDPDAVATFDRARLGDLPLASNLGLWTSVNARKQAACDALNRKRILKAEPDVTM